MTINRDRKEIELECNGCGDTTDVYDESDFNLMIDDAKKQGWSIRKEAGLWIHICPSCVKGD